jgi:hypothetical protein
VGDITEAWVTRANAVLGTHDTAQTVQFANSLLTAMYGPESTQIKTFTNALAQIAKVAANATNCAHNQMLWANGTIRNVLGEIESGLIVNLRALVAGEVFAELVGLGKEILADGTEPSKNVAAVLIAAAFEDLLRRMGTELAGVLGRPNLEDVIGKLKSADVLKGGEVGTALSYLKFRNDSLHADWTKVQTSQVQSCIAFIEALLIKHFS